MKKKIFNFIGLMSVALVFAAVLSGCRWGTNNRAENANINGTVETEDTVGGNEATGGKETAGDSAAITEGDLTQELDQLDQTLNAVNASDFDSAGLSDSNLGL